MSGKRTLPKGWRWVNLGDKDVAEIGAGNSAPQGVEYFEGGEYPFVRTHDVGREGKTPCLVETSDKLNAHALQTKTLRLWPEYTILIPKSGASTFLNHRAMLGRPAYVSSHLATVVPQQSILPEFLYFFSLTIDAKNIAPKNNYPSLRLPDIAGVPIPLPLLAVQERIVEVLQQADAIRRKRAEARRLADQILPALFLDMFGDPVHNPRGWPMRRIGSFCRVMRGAHPRPAGDPRYFNGDIPIAYIADVTKEPSRILSKTNLTVTEEGKRKSRFLKEGTLVVTGNTTTGIPKILGMDCCVHDGFRAFTELSNEVERDYLYWYFRNTVEFYERLTPGEGLRGGLKVSDYDGFEIPFPPKPYQTQLAETLNRAEDILLGQLEALPMQEDTFSILLSRAFAGELTAEWETANANWIAERQVFYERLPRLALLALLLERCERAGRDAVTLITALMKYAFLAQMEGELHRPLYRFVPYHYGPCAMELYGDLNALASDGLIAVDNNAEEEKTRITLTDQDRAAALLDAAAHKDDALLAALEDGQIDPGAETDPATARLLKRRAEVLETLRSDAATILDAYGDLDHNNLLKTVYEKYPTYARKSLLRRKQG